MMDDEEITDGEDIDRGSPGGRARRRKRNICGGGAVPEIANSALATYLQESWSWGKYSPQECQRLAHLAMTDIRRAQQCSETMTFLNLEKLAKLGGSGKHPSNMHVEMDAAMPPVALPKVDYFDLPIKNPTSGLVEMTVQSILLPHMMLHAFFSSMRHVFFSRLVPEVGIVEKFWKDVSHSEHYKTHPVRHRKNHRRRCIPIFLHGDGVPVVGVGKSWSKLVDVWSWGSILQTDGATNMSNFLIFAFYQMLATVETYDEFWKVLVWSLLQCWTGKFHDRDLNGDLYEPGTLGFDRKGKEIAGGWFMALWISENDLDHLASHFNFRHWMAAMPCSWCPCTNSVDAQPWTDMNPGTAAWMLNVYKHSDFMAAFAPLHAIFSVPGVTILTFWPDYMHTKYMGVDQFFLASILVIGTFMTAIPGCLFRTGTFIIKHNAAHIEIGTCKTNMEILNGL